ncbi:MAG: hypothetical protein KDD43_14975 [Bdellovibrionales bacterium]|nr:hypothetical protein [Bdellovibrionales bacterium]
MRKVINGKTYRTHTAQLIVTLPSHFPKTANKWHETRLYRNQQGDYFLAGEGGASSRWAKNTPRGAIPGKGIEPISKAEALAYAKYAGLSLDKFARAGFERVEAGHWLIDGQDIQNDWVIGRSL